MHKLSEVTYCLSLGVAAEAWGTKGRKGTQRVRERESVWFESAQPALTSLLPTEDEMASSPKSSHV